MTKARDLANLIAAGNPLADGAIAYSEVTGTPTIPVAGTDFVAQTGGTFTGDVSFTGELIADSYNETYATLTAGGVVTVDCETGNVFALTTNQSMTFAFNNPPASGTAYGFTLKLTSGISGTITWPTSVDWAGGSAPDAPANGETDMLAFITYDGGVTWYGFQAGAAMA